MDIVGAADDLPPRTPSPDSDADDDGPEDAFGSLRDVDRIMPKVKALPETPAQAFDRIVACAAASKSSQSKRAGVRFAAESDSDDDTECTPIPINPLSSPAGSLACVLGGGTSGSGGGGGVGMSKVSSSGSLAGLAAGSKAAASDVSTGTMATPHLTHEQLKYKRVTERVAPMAPSASRPDAPDTEDMLRRISVVLLQHIQRGERAHAEINVRESAAASPAFQARRRRRTLRAIAAATLSVCAASRGGAAAVHADNVVTDCSGFVRSLLRAVYVSGALCSKRQPQTAAPLEARGLGGNARRRRGSADSDDSSSDDGDAGGERAEQAAAAAAAPEALALAAADRCWRSRVCCPCRWLRDAETDATGGGDCGGGSSDDEDDDEFSGGDHNIGDAGDGPTPIMPNGFATSVSSSSLSLLPPHEHSRDGLAAGAAIAAPAASAPPLPSSLHAPPPPSPRTAFYGAQPMAASPATRFVVHRGADSGSAAGSGSEGSIDGMSVPQMHAAARTAAAGSAAAGTDAAGPSPEDVYDAEVEEDVFHEARYLQPRFTALHARAPGSLTAPLAGCGVGAAVQRVRYTFATPSSQDIYEWLRRMYPCIAASASASAAPAAASAASSLTAESCIICLVYVERLMEGGRVLLRCHNWRTIALCGLLLASKVWDDLGSWSVEFAAAYPQFPVHAVNALERAFVSRLGFNLYISGSVYARYYFALRSLNEQRSFRRRYMSVVHAPQAAPQAMVKRIEQKTKDMKVSLYSRSL